MQPLSINDKSIYHNQCTFMNLEFFAVLYLFFVYHFVLVTFPIAEKWTDFIDRHVWRKAFGKEMTDSPDERREAEWIRRQIIMNIGNFPGWDKDRIRKRKNLIILTSKQKLLIVGIFVMSGNKDQFHLIEYLHTFWLLIDLFLYFVHKLIRRVVFDSNERMGDVYK